MFDLQPPSVVPGTVLVNVDLCPGLQMQFARIYKRERQDNSGGNEANAMEDANGITSVTWRGDFSQTLEWT